MRAFNPAGHPGVGHQPTILPGPGPCIATAGMVGPQVLSHQTGWNDLQWPVTCQTLKWLRSASRQPVDYVDRVVLVNVALFVVR
jgi:hypothetical protein